MQVRKFILNRLISSMQLLFNLDLLLLARNLSTVSKDQKERILLAELYTRNGMKKMKKNETTRALRPRVRWVAYSFFES